MRKLVYCICLKQRHTQLILCMLISAFVFHCLDSLIIIDFKFGIENVQLAPAAVQAGLCLIWSETL